MIPNDFTNTINQVSQKTFEAVRQIGEINVRASEQLFAQHVAFGGALLDAGVRHIELLTKSRTVQEFVTLQTQLVQEQGQQVLGNIQSAAEILKEAGQAVHTVIEDGVKTVRENMNAVA